MNIYYVTITLLSLILKEVSSQTCKVYNQENNLLTMAVNETFRLPLNNYFIGEGLLYELSNNSGFTLAQQQWGPSEINGTIISTTSVQFNNNLNIVTFQYFALVSQNNEYQILGSNISMDPLLITYSNILNTINNATCYTINYVQGYIFVTCFATNNGLVFYFYQLNGVFHQSYPYPNITASNNSVITTSTYDNYMIVLMNEGQIVNGSYISLFSKSIFQRYDTTSLEIERSQFQYQGINLNQQYNGSQHIFIMQKYSCLFFVNNIGKVFVKSVFDQIIQIIYKVLQQPLVSKNNQCVINETCGNNV